MGDPVLYGLSRSVYTRIARLALEEKGVRYTLEEVEIFGPAGVPAEHRARQPFGRIPAFTHDGFTLYETGAITRYVDEAFTGMRLQPQDAQARARMHQTIGIVDSYCYRPMIWGVFFVRIVAPAEGIQPDEGHSRRDAGEGSHLLPRARGNTRQQTLFHRRRAHARGPARAADPVVLLDGARRRRDSVGSPALACVARQHGCASERAADQRQVRARYALIQRRPSTRMNAMRATAPERFAHA